MAMTQNINDWRDELPTPSPKPAATLAEALEDMAVTNPDHAAAVLEWSGSALTPSDLTDLLRSRARGGWMEMPDAPLALAWCDLLIQKGADPFACKQVDTPSRFGGSYQRSFFEGIVRGGFWAYASTLALANEQTKADALAALARLDDDYGDGMLRTLADGGARGVELGLAVGMDPNAKLKDGRETPWAMMCSDGPAILELAKAGADLAAPDKHGTTLEWLIAQKPGGKARQGMLEAFAQGQALRVGTEEGAQDSGGFQESSRALEVVARDGSFKELSKLAVAVGVKLSGAKGPSGWGLFETALLNANWSLALKMMDAGEADPSEDCGLGFPCGALALWGEPAARRVSKANQNAHHECLNKALSGACASVSFGPALLESVHGSRARGALARRKEGEWKDAPEREVDRGRWERLEQHWNAEASRVFFEKLQGHSSQESQPFWARARDAGMSQMQVAQLALARPSEPTVDALGRSLWATVAVDMETGRSWSDSMAGARRLMDGFEMRSRSGLPQLVGDLALDQAWVSFWDESLKEMANDVGEGYARHPKSREMANSMDWALRMRAKLAQREGGAPSWTPEMLVAAWEPGLREGSSAEPAMESWIQRWAQSAKPPGKENEVFDAALALELLRLGTPASLKSADALASSSREMSHRAFVAPVGLADALELSTEPLEGPGTLAWSALCEAAGVDAVRAREAKAARDIKLARSRRL
jgi:hypothetical protein